MMNVLNIILLTLLSYSFIATMTYILSKENDDILAAFGLGCFGLSLVFIVRLIRKISKLIKYSKLCSLYKETNTGNVYKCKTKDSHNMDWMQDYEIVKRYKKITECEDIPWVSKEVLEKSRINCDNCIYDNVCDGSIYSDGSWNYHGIKCKHDKYGAVVEFDKFVKK